MLLRSKAKIGVLVVTYNRLELLTKLIHSLTRITYPMNEILIFDNNSSYSLQELQWIKDANFSGSPTVRIYRSPSNLGGSGGFSRGIEMLVSSGNDYVWTMDDDISFSSNTLDVLVSELESYDVVAPVKVSQELEIIDVCTTKLTLETFFIKSHKQDLFRNLDKGLNTGTYKVETFSFEGSLFNVEVFSSIGFPVKNYFICHDDLEYSFRLKQNNYNIGLSTNCYCKREFRIDRYANFFNWKTYFVLRNYFWVNYSYGMKRSWFMRPLFFSMVVLLLNITKGNVNNIVPIIRAINDGFEGEAKN